MKTKSEGSDGVMGEQAKKWITITVPYVDGNGRVIPQDPAQVWGGIGYTTRDGRPIWINASDVAQAISAWPSEPTTDYAKRLADIEAWADRMNADDGPSCETSGFGDLAEEVSVGAEHVRELLAQLRERDEQLADAIRDRDEMKALARRVMFTQEQPLRCRKCGGVAEEDRRCWAHPTCHACLPPPPPLAVVDVGGSK